MARDEIGSATFGLVVGMQRFKGDLAEGRQVAAREGDRIGDELAEGIGEGVERGAGDLGSKLGDALKGIAAGAGAAIGAGILDGLNREAGTDLMAAQMGLSPAAAQEAGHIAGNVYAQAWGESLPEVNQAVSDVMSTLGTLGVQGADDIESATIKAQALADTFGFDVATNVANVGVLLSTGLARDADEAFDLITAAMQRTGPVARDEVMAAAHEYSQFFAGLGFSGEQAFGILVNAADGGIYAIDKAGDAIKEFQIRAQDGSAATVGAYETLGLDAERMGQRVASGGAEAQEAFQAVVAELLAMEDPALRAQTAVALFGTPFEDIAGDGAKVTEVLTALATGGMERVDGAAQRMADTLGSNARSEVEAFGRTMRTELAEVIDEHVLPAIVGLPGPLDEMAMGLLAVGGQAGSLIGDLGPLGLALKGIGGGGGAAGGGALGGVTSSVGGLAGGFAAALPWIAAFAAAILIGYLIYEHWDEIKAFFGAFWQWLQQTWDAGLEWVKGATSDALQWFVDQFMTWSLVGILIRHWDTIKETAGNALDWVVDKALSFIRWWTDMPGRLRAAGRGMWDWLGDGFRSVLNTLIRGWNGLDFKLPSFGGFEVAGRTIIPSWEGPTLGMPDIPQLHTGGIVQSPGLVNWRPGEEVLSMPRGATVTPLDRVGAQQTDDGGGGDTTVVLEVDGQTLGRVVLKALQRMTRLGGPLRLKVRD